MRRRTTRPVLISLAIACFAIGGFFLFQNLRATWATLDAYPNAAFWNVFLSTQGATGVEPQLVLFVWGPPILVGLGVVLLVAHFAVRAVRAGAGVAVVGAGAASTHAWQQGQQQQGWQQPTADQQQGWAQQPGWQQRPAQQQAAPQQQPGIQQPGTVQPGPVQPLGGTQPPPPNAADRIDG